MITEITFQLIVLNQILEKYNKQKINSPLIIQVDQ